MSALALTLKDDYGSKGGGIAIKELAAGIAKYLHATALVA